MTNNLIISEPAANLISDTVCALLNNGYLRIYDGTRPLTADTIITDQTLLAELRFSATAFAAATSGQALANALASVMGETGGNATWFRALSSDGTTVVFDGSVGVGEGYNLRFNSVAITTNKEAAISTMTYKQLDRDCWWLRGDILPSHCVAAFQPLRAVNLDESLINLATPGVHDALVGIASNFSPLVGWSFDGSTMYLETDIVPASDQTWSVIIRVSGVTNTATFPMPFGAFNAGGEFFIAFNGGSNEMYYSNGDSAVRGINAPVATAGIFGIAGLATYRNGIEELVSIGSDVGAGAILPLYIGAANSDAPPSFYFAGDIQAIAIYDCTLTPEQVLAVSNAMAEISTVPEWALAGGVNPVKCVAAYQPIGAASLAASYINLANPGTYNAAPGVAPTFNAATGWTFDGATTYLTTGIVPAGDQTWSVLVRLNYLALAEDAVLGSLNDDVIPADQFSIGPGGVYCANGKNIGATNLPAASADVLGFAGLIPYRNGVAELNNIGEGAAVAPLPALYIGALNFLSGEENTPVAFCSAEVLALAIYSCTLTAPQVLAISNAMADLKPEMPAWAIAGGVDPTKVVAVYQPLGAADIISSLVNLANPGVYDIFDGVPPTWAVGTGWTFDGATTYLMTGIVPAQDQSWSMLIRYSSAVGDEVTLAGFFDDDLANVFEVRFSDAGDIILSYNGQSANYASNNPALASGIYGFAGLQPYRNGIAEAVTIGAGAATAPLGSIYIGALNVLAGGINSASRFVLGSIQALAIYSCVLTAPQVLAISTAMAEFYQEP